MKAITALLLVLASVGACAQDIPMLGPLDPFNLQSGSGLAEVISGKATPLQRTLKDFDESWRRFTVPATGESPLGYLALLAGAAGPVLPGPPTYYTRGETVNVGAETFIVAYRRRDEGPGLPALIAADREGQAPPRPEPLALDTPLHMCLLNVRSLGSLNEIRPVVAATEIEESKAAVARMWDALTRMAPGPGAAPVVTGEPAKPAKIPAPKTAPKKQ
jgi:hypothetical protein